MRKILLTMGVAGLLIAAGQAAWADDQENDWNDWQDQFHFRLEGFDTLMQGMDELLRSIPRYEAPIIDENGDIIIRRAPPGPGLDPWFRNQPTEPEFADI
jgi:hypothetical protein